MCVCVCVYVCMYVNFYKKVYISLTPGPISIKLHMHTPWASPYPCIIGFSDLSKNVEIIDTLALYTSDFISPKPLNRSL